MNQFDAAKSKYEKKFVQRLGEQAADMGKVFEEKPESRPILHLNKPPKTNARNNEIDVSIYARGMEFKMRFSADVGGTLMASQINQSKLTEIVREAIAAKFGKVKTL